MSNRDRCEACLYWQCLDRFEHDDVGRCRRHAPQTVKDSRDNTFRNWPCTFHDDWCGEFADSGRQLEGELQVVVSKVAHELDELGLPLGVSTLEALQALCDSGNGRSIKVVRAALDRRRIDAKYVKWDDVDVDPFR